MQEAIEFLKVSGSIKKASELERQLGLDAAKEPPESKANGLSADGSATSSTARTIVLDSSADDIPEEMVQQLQVRP